MFRKRGLWTPLFLLLMLAAILLGAAGAYAESDGAKPPGGSQEKLVYVIPAHQTIESGLEQFLERAYKDAEKHHAAYIILDVDTLGGRVDAALDIGKLIRESSVPTAAYVHGNAISAGSYIALNANKIIMEPGSSIGAAAVVDPSGKEVESPKVIAFWTGKMKEAAELRGRNPLIAAKMVDQNVVLNIPELGGTLEKGRLLSLTSLEASKVGYADKLASSHEEVIQFLQLEGAQVYNVKLTAAEQLARILTTPWVMTLLLIVGLAGIAIELFVPGFGIPGITGIISFSLYFFGHYVAGFAGVEDILLFVIGVVLMAVEVFVPGFGLLALAGIICLVSGVILAAYDTSSAAVSLGVAFLIAVVVAAVFISYFKHRGIWNKFILKDELKTELGYVSQSEKDYLLGKKGSALTPLRPAGTAKIEGARVDVVTAGEFIEAGKQVTVVQVEGARVVVSEAAEEWVE